MTPINTGTTANDGTGDTLRGAFTKANANFTEAQTALTAAAAHAARTDNPHATTKAHVGLPNVDNTSDANKPVSTAQAAALAAKADLVGGKVPAAQLPSYVDDVIEAANLGAFPGTGETGKIYTAIDTRKIFRWSGSGYFEISSTPALASQAEAQAGTDNFTLMTPLRTTQALAGKLSDAPSDGRVYGRKNGAWVGVDLPPFATHVTDISSWGVGGGTPSLDGDGNVTFDTPETVDSINASTTGGFGPDSVVRADICPALTFLALYGNATLTIPPVVTGLNLLTELDLSNTAIAVVPDLTGLALLVSVYLPNMAITDADQIDMVYIQLDANGASNGTVDTSGNVAPTSASDDARANLIVRGWTVIHD